MAEFRGPLTVGYIPPVSAPKVFVGREEELERLRRLVVEACSGRGRAVLVEGEPGIGKSTLLRMAQAMASRRGLKAHRIAADELGQRFPLRALLEAMDTGQRAEILDGESGADPVLAAIERLLSMVDKWCATGPVLLILDDLQWADEASLLVWSRLAHAVDQLPLLLVAASRPVPRRPEVVRLRQSVVDSDGVVITLDPLPAATVTELVGALSGAAAGPQLIELAHRAGGNPLYIRELVDALGREGRLEIGAKAEVTGDLATIPAADSLTAAITGRLGFLTEPTIQVLRVAALLGAEFSVTDLATITGRPPTALMTAVEEAIAAAVLGTCGPGLAFRHPLIREVLHESTPLGLRTALHRQAARALADAGARVERVAEQLLAAAPDPPDEWALDWLTGRLSVLSARSPQVTVTLIKQALGAMTDDDPRAERLQIGLVTLQRLLNRFDEAEPVAREVLERTTDPARAAQMAWILAYSLLGTDRAEQALDVVAQTLRDEQTPPRWSARLRALRAVTLDALGRYQEAGIAVADALPAGQTAKDRYAIAFALHAKALITSRESHGAALALIEQALATTPDGMDGLDLRLLLLGNRLQRLVILDRFAEVETAAKEVLLLAENAGTARFAAIRVSAAQAYFTTGRWDDALAELEPAAELATDLTNNRPKLIVLHGLAALLAAHREDRDAAVAHLDAAKRVKVAEGSLRRSSDYLMAARAAVAEQDGDLAGALAALAPALDPEGAKDMTKRLPLLPHLVRLALVAADFETVHAALEISMREAERDRIPGALTAVQRCRGIVAGDEELLRTAAGHYRGTGRSLEFGNTMEDLAELLGRAGRTTEARAAFLETFDVYTALGASWDLRRAQTRMRPFGIRPGRREQRKRPSLGWAALTPTELTVARLVAKGLSNPDIASRLFLSRRTVQTHVSHILGKLGVRSRVEIAREAVQHTA